MHAKLCPVRPVVVTCRILISPVARLGMALPRMMSELVWLRIAISPLFFIVVLSPLFLLGARRPPLLTRSNSDCGCFGLVVLFFFFCWLQTLAEKLLSSSFPLHICASSSHLFFSRKMKYDPWPSWLWRRGDRFHPASHDAAQSIPHAMRARNRYYVCIGTPEKERSQAGFLVSPRLRGHSIM